MAYRDEDIRTQLQLGEDAVWEFKAVEFAGSRPRSPRRDDFADEMAAFANADGGVLLCGVTDDGEVQGMSREQIVALDSLLVETSTDSIRPAIRIRTYHRQLDGRPFMLVEVPEGDSQHDSPGGSYIRVGGSKRSMTSDERLRLAQRRGQARFLWFDKQTVGGTGFGTLDEVLWKSLLSAEGLVDPELALEKMGLLAPDENGTMRATVAGVLLCSSAPEEWLPNACVTATCYRGTDRASGQLDSQTIVGPINRQITHALTFAVRNMGIAARKEPARQDLPQYSENALFEALVNAVVHRDYSIKGSRIRLSMFEDRLELCSPGSLPNNLTIESMGDRQSTRNEVADLRPGQDERRRDRRCGWETILYGAKGRRCPDNQTCDPRIERLSSRLPARRRIGVVSNDSRGTAKSMGPVPRGLCQGSGGDCRDYGSERRSAVGKAWKCWRSSRTRLGNVPAQTKMGRQASICICTLLTGR